MRHTGTVTKGWIAVLCVPLLVSCSGGDDADDAEPVEVPSGFVVPEGIELTDPEAELSVGDRATVIMSVDDRTSSVVTIEPAAVERGDIEDFTGFSLGDDLSDAAPYYVTVNVENLGPAGIGGAAVPLYINIGVEGTIFPPNDIIGRFPPCPDRVLPESLLPEESAELCLVYLAPEGSAPQGFEFVTAGDDRIMWDYTPPADDEDDGGA